MNLGKRVFRSGPYKDLFAQGVKVGDVLYLAGQVGVRADGTPGADLVEQTRLAYANINEVLLEFAVDLDRVVDETVFVTDMGELMANLEAVFGARAEAYGGPPEVSLTLVQVSGLVLPELKIEIKCIARL